MEENGKRTDTDHGKKIDVNDKAAVRRWCLEFQCNEMRLKNAVRAVGPSAEAVRKYMTKKF
jgi:hypothetical protein